MRSLYRSFIEVLLKNHFKFYQRIITNNIDLSFVGVYDGFGNGKTQTVMPRLIASCRISAVKTLKQTLSLLFGDLPPLVDHRQTYAPLLFCKE